MKKLALLGPILAIFATSGLFADPITITVTGFVRSNLGTGLQNFSLSITSDTDNWVSMPSGRGPYWTLSSLATSIQIGSTNLGSITSDFVFRLWPGATAEVDLLINRNTGGQIYLVPGFQLGNWDRESNIGPIAGTGIGGSNDGGFFDTSSGTQVIVPSAPGDDPKWDSTPGNYTFQAEVTANAVPEPGTLLLLSGGLLSLGFLRRKSQF